MQITNAGLAITSHAHERFWMKPLNKPCFTLRSSFVVELKRDCKNIWKFKNTFQRNARKVGESLNSRKI